MRTPKVPERETKKAAGHYLSGRPQVFHVTGEHIKYLPEREIRIAASRISIAVTLGNRNGLFALHLADKFIHENGLAAPSTANNKDYPPMAVQCFMEVALQII